MPCYLCLTDTEKEDLKLGVGDLEQEETRRSTALRFSKLTPLRILRIAEAWKGSTPSFEPLEVMVDGVVHPDEEVLSARISRALSKRSSVTMVLNGLHGSGKEALLQNYITTIITSLAPHIDISARLSTADTTILSPKIHLCVQPPLGPRTPTPMHLATTPNLPSQEKPRRPSRRYTQGDEIARRSSHAIAFTRSSSVKGSSVSPSSVPTRPTPPSIKRTQRRLGALVSQSPVQLQPIDKLPPPLLTTSPVFVTPMVGPLSPTPEVFGRQGQDVNKEVREQFSGTQGKKGRKVLLFENETLAKLPVPFFPRIAESFKIDFWIQTEMRKTIMKVFEVLDLADSTRLGNVFSITLNIDTKGDYASPGSLRVYLRDSGHGELAAGYDVGPLFDGEWHFVEVHVVSAASRSIAVFVDGGLVGSVGGVDKPDGTEDYGPTGFATWQPVAFVGATTICKGEDPIHHLPCLNTFKGKLADIAIWETGKDKALLARFPLADPKGIRDMVSGARGESIRGTWVVGNFPSTFLRLSGDAHVNVENLGRFGELLSFFSVELWMRSSVVDRQMCLLKTTGASGQTVGMTVHSDGKGYCKDELLVELQDAKGRTMVGSVSADLCDGVWHHVYWAFHYGDVMVVMDGVPAEVTVTSNAPTAFSQFRTPFAIGAHNNNGTVEQYFDGYISGLEISAAKKPFAKWKLKDGPGSLVLEDSVGRHSGTFMHKNDRVKKHNYWAPWHPIDGHGFISSEIEDLIKSLEWRQVEMHNNNVVRGACLVVETSTGGREVLTDVLHDVVVEGGSLPEDVWLVMKGFADVKEFYESTAARYVNATEAAGHITWLLGIGDAVFCLCMVAGTVVRPGAFYNPATLRWQGPISSFGKGHRKTLHRNESITSFETDFLKKGSRPELWHATNEQSSLTVSLLSSFMQNSLQNTFFLQTCGKGPCGTRPCADISYAFAILGGLQKADRLNACITIQRSVRRYLAKAAVSRRRATLRAYSKRYSAPHRTSSVASALPPLPHSPPHSLPFATFSTVVDSTIKMVPTRSKKLRALLIASYLPLDNRVEPALEVTHHMYELYDVLTRVGYEVVMVHSKSADYKLRPTRDVTLAKVKSFLEADAAYSLVWVAGRGSAVRGMYNPPMLSSFRRWMEGDEREAREIIEEDYMLELRCIVALYPYRRPAAVSLPTPKAKASISERYNYTYTRWAGSSNKKIVGDSVPSPKTPRHSDPARQAFGRFETDFRYKVADLESSARSRMFTMLDEDLEWAKRYPSCHARHVMLDDSPLACTEAAALTVTKLSELVLNSKYVHSKMLVVDCIGWRGEAGHFFVGSAAGTYTGDYCINTGHGTPSYMLVSLWLTRALAGIPGTTQSEHVTVERVSEYIMSRLAKYPRVQLTPDSGASEACPKIRMTKCIAKSRQDLHAEKEHASLVGMEHKKQYWSLLSCNADVDVFDSSLRVNLDAYLKTASAVRGTELVKVVPLPWVEIEVALAMSRLVRLHSDLLEELEEACSPFEISITMRPAPTLPSIKHSARRGSAAQYRRSSGSGMRSCLDMMQTGGGVVKQTETSIIRVVLKGADEVKDPRWLVASKKASHPDIAGFCKHVRRWVLIGGIVPGLCRSSLGFPIPCVGLRQCCVLHGFSDSIGTSRLVKMQRNGFLMTAGVAFDSMGVFLGPEEDRLCSMSHLS